MTCNAMTWHQLNDMQCTDMQYISMISLHCMSFHAIAFHVRCMSCIASGFHLQQTLYCVSAIRQSHVSAVRFSVYLLDMLAKVVVPQQSAIFG